jgi:hypothetical protein
MRVHERPAGGDTSRAAAGNYDLGIAAGHALLCGDLSVSTIRRPELAEGETSNCHGQ